MTTARYAAMCIWGIAAALAAATALGQPRSAQDDLDRVLDAYRRQLDAAGDDAQRAAIQYRIATDLLAANRLQEAAMAFRQALALGDATLAITALDQAAPALLHTGQCDALIGLCHLALERHGDSENVRAPALFYAARAHEAKGEREKAIAQYEALLEECPRSLWRTQAAQLLANLHVAAGDSAAAQGVLTQELKRSPGNVTLGFRLITILEQGGDIARATALCERLLADQPQAEIIAQKLYQLRKQSGQLDAYIADMRRALQRDPTDTTLRRRLANVYMSEKRYAEAIAGHEKLLEALPSDAALHQRLAWLYEQQGDLHEAKQHYEAALALQPHNVSLYVPLGDVYMRLGDDGAAVDAWKRASAYRANDPQAVSRLGRLLYEHGRYDLALRMYGEARALLGDEAAFAQEMAMAHEALLDFEGAIGEYLRAAVAASTQAGPIPQAASLAAELAEAEDKLPFLIEKAAALLQDHPGNSALVAVLARAYARAGESSKAAELLAAAADTAPAPSGFILLLAEAFLEQGDADAAAGLFAQAHASPADGGVQAEAAIGLAQARAARGHWQDAADALETALADGSPVAADARVQFELADIYLQHLKKIDRARALYEAVPVHDAATAHRVEMGVADCLFARGEYDEAAERYAELAAAQPPQLPRPPPPPFSQHAAEPEPVMWWGAPQTLETARARYMVAECALRSESLERAEKMFQQLATDAPGSREANDALGRVQLIRSDMALDPDGARLYIAALNGRDSGAQQRAHKALEELLAAKPRGPLADDALMLLASMLVEQGEIAGARSAYERLIATQPGSPLRVEAILALGCLCRDRLGDESAAAFHFDRLLREYPHSPLAARARLQLDELEQSK